MIDRGVHADSTEHHNDLDILQCQTYVKDMALNYDIRRFSGLHERVQRFAEIVGELVQTLNLEKSGGRGPRGEPASDRVVRDYVRRRVLSPTLRGPDSDERGYYGFRHLVEFLAARVLLNDGWPLEKISERNRSASTEELIALIPGQIAENDAVRLARSFRAGVSASYDAPKPSTNSPPEEILASYVMHEASMDSASLEPMVSAARSRAELPLLMRQLTASERPPQIGKLASIALGDQVTLLISQDLVRNITPVEADLIGRTVAAALIDYRNLSKARSDDHDD
jgi:hypothetical protein